VAHRLSTIQGADKIAVIKNGQVIEFGGHHELIQKSEGAYAALVHIQEKTPSSQDTSTINPTLHALMPSEITGQALPSKSCASIRFESLQGEEQLEVNAEAKPPTSSSICKLLALNASGWKHTLMGCVGGFGHAAVQITYSFILGSLVSVLFFADREELISQVRIYSIVFIALGVLCFLMSLVQHYNFAVMGEFLTRRIRETMFSKILTFEVGWFDLDQNSSGVVCSRLAKEANVVRALVGDCVSLLVECRSGILIAFTLGLVVAWQLAIVLIALQPMMVVCFYTKKILVKTIARKSVKAQNQGSQLAVECFTHHRTTTAFCSQERIIQLFDSTQEGPSRKRSSSVCE